MSRRRALTTLLAVAALLLGVTASAHAAATLAQVVRDFRADGAISACKYDVSDLRRVRHDAKANRKIATKAFRKALRAAITRLKQGGCPTKRAPTATTPTTTATTPTTTVTTPTATTTTTSPQAGPGVRPPASGSGSGGSEAATVVLICAGALALVLVLAALVLALAARRGWEPEWALGARHTVGEAGYRVSATWADFRDWLRLGR